MNTEGSKYWGLIVMKIEKQLSIQREFENEWYIRKTMLIEPGSLIA